jgi:hypothetical protein
MARADVDYEGISQDQGQGYREPYNFAAQSLIELVQLALHSRDICLFERQSFRLQRL